MLNIHRIEHLARTLGKSPAALDTLAESAAEYIEDFTAWDPERPDRPRAVISVGGELRATQERLHRLFRRKFSPCASSFGGVHGRDILQNAKVHLGNEFLFSDGHFIILS